MNDVKMTGRAVKDCEVRSTNSGKEVASFSIAVKKRVKNAEGKYDSDFFSVTAWSYLAEKAKSISKGDEVFVSGYLENSSWTGSNGEKKYMTKITADEIIIAGKSSGNYQANASVESQFKGSNDPQSDTSLPFDL